MVAKRRRGSAALAVGATAAVVASLSACDSRQVVPRSSAGVAPTISATANLQSSPAAPGPATARPTVLPSASPPPSAEPIGTIDLHYLDREHVPGSALRSAAGQIVWSGGPSTSTQVWRYEPGAKGPVLVVDVGRRGSTISDVVASDAGWAFVEVNSSEFGPGGWRIWFVDRPGARPVELDRGLAYGAGFPPTLAMDDDRVAWAAFDEPPSGDISVLRVVDVDRPEEVQTLREGPVRDGLLWLPALNGDELWYAILHPDWGATGAGDEFHLERLDLASRGEAPVPFEGTANDFSPAVTDEHLAWKTAIGDGAALNWGTVTVLDRESSARSIVPLENLNRPSLGARFLTFEEITRSHLAVFDLATGRLEELLPKDPGGEFFVGGQSISGSLLTFFRQEPGGLPRIGWAELPH